VGNWFETSGGSQTKKQKHFKTIHLKQKKIFTSIPPPPGKCSKRRATFCFKEDYRIFKGNPYYVGMGGGLKFLMMCGMDVWICSKGGRRGGGEREGQTRLC
jgi:hypothetical protein